MNNIVAWVGAISGSLSMIALFFTWYRVYFERSRLNFLLSKADVNNQEFVALTIINDGYRPIILSELVCLAEANDGVYHYGNFDRWQNKQVFPLLLEPAKSEYIILMSKDNFINGKYHTICVLNPDGRPYVVSNEYVDDIYGGKMLIKKLNNQTTGLREKLKKYKEIYPME